MERFGGKWWGEAYARDRMSVALIPNGYNFGSLESRLSTTVPFLSEGDWFREFKSSRRLRISTPRVSPALQWSQTGLWILRTANRWQIQGLKFTSHLAGFGSFASGVAIPEAPADL
jgi:hypothetical protein